MKPNRSLRALLALSAMLVATAGADPAEELQVKLVPGSQGTFTVNWNDVKPERAYFVQYSLDLVTWYYAPIIEFGVGEHTRGIKSDARKLFVRLDCAESDEMTNLDDALGADLDDDGLGNLFEVMNGYNPFMTDTNGDGAADGMSDADSDGSVNIIEQAYGRDPAVKDHPKAELVVTVE